MKIKFTKCDIILILIIVVVSVLSIVYMSFDYFKDNKLYVKIYKEDILFYQHELLDDFTETVYVEGEVYYNLVVIDKGRVYVKDANCPDKICKRHIPISRQGQLIVCIPNKVIITIESNNNNDNNDVDAITK